MKIKSLDIDLVKFKDSGLSGMLSFVLSKDIPVCIFASNPRRLEVIRRYFLENSKTNLNIVNHITDIAPNFPDFTGTNFSALGRHFIADLHISYSFETENICFVSDVVFLGDLAKTKQPKKQNLEKLIKESQSFVFKDLVVHKDYGIGRFLSLEKLEVDGVYHDFLKIEFKGGDLLYVLVEHIDKISKYGSASAEVELDSMKSKSWKERMLSARKKIRDIAKDLIKTAANRKFLKSEIFSTNEIYCNFCNQFEYIETDDQAAAISDVEKDLSSGILANRLICGDVGFGKTEVAMRATMLVVSSKFSDGMPRQVAMMAPTTLLARQHFETFRKRFAKFNIRIEKLSRFTTKSDVKKIKESLKKGEIDILISTHAILSRDVEFANLKLLIIDEEQLFGVEQKEKISQKYPGVNVISMSATPIPRTLQLSMSGVKDISIIATPPISRLVTHMDIFATDEEDRLREAILFEKSRHGGVFIVTPYIKELDYLSKVITRIAPNVRSQVAHGKLMSDEIEDVMEKFMNQEIDVLISTSIIASGIDLPHVNTIIIHKPEHFGMGQLYQMRGRVGRSDKLAYCYFMPDSMQIMKNKDTSDKLSALLNINTLGSGFEIASFDLDIRGGGNILGHEQSGKIKDIGIELYQDLLNQEIENIRSNKSEEAEDLRDAPKINLRSEIFIPEAYIKDVKIRMNFYRRLGACRDKTSLDDIFYEIQDRFGKLPHEVRNLRSAGEIRILCYKFGIASLTQVPLGINFEFYKNISPPKDIVDAAINAKNGWSIVSKDKIQLKGNFTLDEICILLKNAFEAEV